MNLCNYKHIFGKPGEGAHSSRFLGLAIVDVALTIVAAIAIAYFFKYNVAATIVVLIIVGIFAHWLFCVPTALNVTLLGKYASR